MNYFKTHKIIALFLAVLMILPLIPAVDLTVFAEGSDYDFSGDVGKKANFNKYFPVPIYHEKPININNDPFFGNDCYKLGYNDFMPPVPSPTDEENSEETYVPQSGTIDDVQAAMAKVTMIIDDWYYNEEADLLWYKVKVIEGDTIQKLEENPWVFHDKVKNSVGENSLILGEKYDILQNAEFVNRTGYFVKSTIRLYNTAFEVYEYMPTSTEVYVAYSFTYMNEWYYWLAGDGFDGGRFCIVKAEDVSFIFDSIINTKVKLKDLNASIDIYADPRADINDFITVDASTLDGVYKVTGVEYSVQKNILFYSLAPCEYMVWPCGDEYTYISSELLEETDAGIAFPIVDFCNPAPIMGYTSQIQPRSAIYGARSAIASPALYSTNSYISTYANDTTSSSDALKLNKIVVPGDKAGTYKITLEAYTTGTVTVTQTTVPMDIILVLDQSYSMRYCIYCGSQNTSGSCNKAPGGYTPIDTPNNPSNNQTSTIKDGNSYKTVYWCNTCKGWYTEQHSSGYRHRETGTEVAENAQHYKNNATHANRLDALKVAAQAFVDGVYEKSAGPDRQYGTTDDVAHRIAVVGFAKSNSGTEIMTSSYGNSQYVLYNNCNANVYAHSLQPTNTTAGRTIISNAVQNVSDDDMSTNSDLGMVLATNIYANNPLEEGRKRVTILFTDGSPSQDQNYFMENVANGAIAEAYKQKNTYGATVYAVGIFDGADASDPTSLPGTGSSPAQDNRYMHLVSSNYLNAESMTNTGNPNDLVKDGTQSYYMSASSTEALNNIFVAISGLVGGTTLPLDSKTVVKDIITPQFTLPSNTTDIKVQKQYCTAYNPNEPFGPSTTWGTIVPLDSAAISIDAQTHSVNVSGFDFAANYVSELGRSQTDDNQAGDFRGAKLVITFTITPDPDFLGGDNVATNGVNSGVYSRTGECFGKFTPGSVNVALKGIENAAQDMHVYYGNVTDLTGILNLSVRESNSQKKLQDIANGINNAYVELKYYVTLEDTTVYTYTIDAGKLWNQGVWESAPGKPVDLGNLDIRADKTYSVYCIMTSVNNRANTSYSNKDDKGNTIPNATAWIYVYKPTLTFEDSEQKYKAVLNRTIESHLKSTEWIAVSINKRSTEVTMEGQAPTLNLTYTPNIENAFANNMMNSVRDVPVNVTVTINGTGPDIPGNEGVTFAHVTCSHPECAFNPATEEFIVHVIGALTSLKIQKVTKNKNGETVSFENIDPNQTFLFRVMGKDADGQDIDVTVTVHAKDRYTIVDGLVIGNQYTVQELTDWSWRYTCELGAYTNDDGTNTSNSFVGNTATLTITALGELNNVATFENTRNTEYWLDGDSWCDNRFMANVTQAIN